jgi:hypothetical protein
MKQAIKNRRTIGTAQITLEAIAVQIERRLRGRQVRR